MDGISVIICCYNSALKIPYTLEYLCKQNVKPNLDWEIIIVNNNSSDKTVETALNYCKEKSCEKKLRIINESKAGLSYARETGVKSALYDVIIFCDDDNLLEENYLQHCYYLVKKTKDLGYSIWGGKTVAYFDDSVQIPDWFEKAKPNYVVGKQGVETGDISERGYVWGAGMIILKQVYLKIVNEKFPSLLNDRTGNILSSGGDSELCFRILILGYKLYYDSNLILHHYIPANKLTKDYNTGLIKGFVAANAILNKYKIFIHYISDRNFFLRIWYSGVYIGKYVFTKMHIKKITSHDYIVLHALFSNNIFHDDDFNLMRRLYKTRNQ